MVQSSWTRHTNSDREARRAAWPAPRRVCHQPDGVRPCLTQCSSLKSEYRLQRSRPRSLMPLFPPCPARGSNEKASAQRAPISWQVDGRRWYGLRRLSKGAQETSANPLTVTKAGFLGDFLDRQPSLIEHISGGLKTKILDGAGRRLAKHPGTLPRAEPRRLGELLHRQRLSKVVPGKGERVPDLIGFRVELRRRASCRWRRSSQRRSRHRRLL